MTTHGHLNKPNLTFLFPLTGDVHIGWLSKRFIEGKVVLNPKAPEFEKNR